MKQTLLRNLLLLLNVLLLCASQCPDHKPFASDAGCVSDCSEPFYIRNNTCVFDCGVDFVDESRQCVLSCPNTYVYRETLKATGTDMFVEKKCIHACDNNEVNFKNECLKRCPKQLVHLTSDEYRCVSKCPPEQQYIQNMTVNDIEYIQCTNKCAQFVHNGVCVSRCPSQMVDLNYVCMKSCPPKYVESGGQCLQECNEISLQLMCKCPKDKPFIEDKVCITNCAIDTFSSDPSFCGEKCFNNITVANSRFTKKSECVAKCSINKPFICNEDIFYRSECAEHVHYGGHKFCLKNCPANSYVQNGSCTPHCLGYIYRHVECLERCPNETFRWVDSNCYNSYPYYERCSTKHCVNTCPENLYSNETDCVEHCSKDQYLRNNTCVSSCNDNENKQSVIYNSGREGYECVVNCKPNLFLYNNSCVHHCPSEMSLSLNRTCVKHCPQEKKLISTVKPPINCSRSRCNVLLNNDFYNYLACNDSCLESELALNGSCVSFCPKGYYYLNDTCLSTCPSYAPFLQPTILTYQTWERDAKVYRVQTYNMTSSTCVGSCSKPYTIYDFQTNTCTVQCTDARPFILEVNYTLTCVQQCPLSENVKVHGKTEIRLGEELKTVNSIHCASYCPNDTFYFNGSCLMACPSQANHIFGGKCVRCAKFTQMIGKLAYCVNDCPQTMFENGNVCVETCPKGNAYVINRRCSICPEEAPFQLPVLLGDDKCVKSCEEDDKLADFSCENCEDAVNAKCIYSYQCNKTVMIDYDGMCLKYCPDGYVFLWDGCIRNIISLLVVVLAGVFSITIGIFSRTVIMEYFLFVHYCFSIPKEIKYVLNQNVDILLDQQQGLDNEVFETRL